MTAKSRLTFSQVSNCRFDMLRRMFDMCERSGRWWAHDNCTLLLLLLGKQLENTRQRRPGVEWTSILFMNRRKPTALTTRHRTLCYHSASQQRSKWLSNSKPHLVTLNVWQWVTLNVWYLVVLNVRHFVTLTVGHFVILNVSHLVIYMFGM